MVVVGATVVIVGVVVVIVSAVVVVVGVAVVIDGVVAVIAGVGRLIFVGSPGRGQLQPLTGVLVLAGFGPMLGQGQG